MDLKAVTRELFASGREEMKHTTAVDQQ